MNESFFWEWSVLMNQLNQSKWSIHESDWSSSWVQCTQRSQKVCARVSPCMLEQVWNLCVIFHLKWNIDRSSVQVCWINVKKIAGYNLNFYYLLTLMSFQSSRHSFTNESKWGPELLQNDKKKRIIKVAHMTCLSVCSNMIFLHDKQAKM